MKIVTGKVLETSPYTLLDHGTTVIPEVRIEGTDGTIYAVRKVGIDARLANALVPGNSGIFYFQKIILGNNLLVAAEFNNIVEFSATGPFRFIVLGIATIFLGIPFLLFFGIGIIFIIMGLSTLYAAIQMMNIKQKLQSSNVNVRQFKTI